jgi:hypothetical protein
MHPSELAEERERRPVVGRAEPEPAKSVRHDADDFELGAVDEQAAADCGRIARELAVPVPVAEDKDAAALMGVDVDRTIAITFAVGGIMAGAAGVMYGLVFRQVAFYMGFVPGLKAFTAAVLGGIGNLAGAVLGGLILGVIESVGPSLFLDGIGIPSPHQLKDGIAFTVLVLILIFRPTGILGERLSKRA